MFHDYIDSRQYEAYEIIRDGENEKLGELEHKVILSDFKENLINIIHDVPLNDNEAVDYFSGVSILETHDDRFNAVVSWLSAIYEAEIVEYDLDSCIKELTIKDVSEII